MTPLSIIEVKIPMPDGFTGGFFSTEDLHTYHDEYNLGEYVTVRDFSYTIDEDHRLIADRSEIGIPIRHRHDFVEEFSGRVDLYNVEAPSEYGMVIEKGIVKDVYIIERNPFIPFP